MATHASRSASSQMPCGSDIHCHWRFYHKEICVVLLFLYSYLSKNSWIWSRQEYQLYILYRFIYHHKNIQPPPNIGLLLYVSANHLIYQINTYSLTLANCCCCYTHWKPQVESTYLTQSQAILINAIWILNQSNPTYLTLPSINQKNSDPGFIDPSRIMTHFCWVLTSKVPVVGLIGLVDHFGLASSCGLRIEIEEQ